MLYFETKKKKREKVENSGKSQRKHRKFLLDWSVTILINVQVIFVDGCTVIKIR